MRDEPSRSDCKFGTGSRATVRDQLNGELVVEVGRNCTRQGAPNQGLTLDDAKFLKKCDECEYYEAKN